MIRGHETSTFINISNLICLTITILSLRGVKRNLWAGTAGRRSDRLTTLPEITSEVALTASSSVTRNTSFKMESPAMYKPWLTAANTSSVASLSTEGSPANSAIVSNSSRGTCKMSATNCVFSAKANRISSSFRRSFSGECKNYS
uniref:Uncharacterized protein n=1 Tax=Timema poppense TaxID=170557 RepID=A0A7R9H2I1_TIMPO|nr:unnamed protein product [Timema poppensis]